MVSVCHMLTLSCVLAGCHLIMATDFYELLGVTREAGSREIRRAFKKLALEKHPDKNTDDPDAHDTFVKINRAYEVLKDEELRKKYDLHGEKGLEENGPSGGSYQSWNFYHQDFGIYDDDAQIITLSRADFEQSVENSKDVWFINFYSPRCSHCHELAPSWREMARQLEGVIRIGAVNCGDEWMLCRNQGIRSYPSLHMYPQREKFHGDRSVEGMVRHVLSSIDAKVLDLSHKNLEAVRNAAVTSTLPWVVTFCGGDGDCLEETTSRKLAAMLKDMVTMASVDCLVAHRLCDSLGVDHGTYYFPPHKLDEGQGLALPSLVAGDISDLVLQQLPDVTDIDAADLQSTLDDLKRSRSEQALLVYFMEGRSEREMKRLPRLLPDIKVVRMDCTYHRTACNSLHIHKFPTFTLFKVGGGHEVHHGRQIAHDIAAFVKDSYLTPVRILGPEDFPGVTRGGQPWFIDFFAPWCPPCMRLLPEFRKASRTMGQQIGFGTVDCTVHTTLCQQYNVHSYPTTVMYNQSEPHQYEGRHTAHGIISFIQDTLHPPVTSLNMNSFNRLLKNKAVGVTWLVYYYAPWCGPCREMSPEWRELAKMMKTNDKVQVGQLDCETHADVCQMERVTGYPTIRLYQAHLTNTQGYQSYTGWHRDAHSIRSWLYSLLPSKTTLLTSRSFQQTVLPSSQPWLIDFYAPWCQPCQNFAPVFEEIAEGLEGEVRAGKVNCDEQRGLCQQAGVRSYPSVRFYRGATPTQSAHGEHIDNHNKEGILRYVRSRLPRKTPKKDEL